MTRILPMAEHTPFDPAPVVPLAAEGPARLVVDAPLPKALARGLVVTCYRPENLRILAVYGPAAVGVSPRVGHLHVTVDAGPWRWLHASGQPINVNKLPPGPSQDPHRTGGREPQRAGRPDRPLRSPSAACRGPVGCPMTSPPRPHRRRVAGCTGQKKSYGDRPTAPSPHATHRRAAIGCSHRHCVPSGSTCVHVCGLAKS